MVDLVKYFFRDRQGKRIIRRQKCRIFRRLANIEDCADLFLPACVWWGSGLFGCGGAEKGYGGKPTVFLRPEVVLGYRG